jgi:hypothetical protein
MKADGQHSDHSSFREKLLEHLFVSELLRHFWLARVVAAEVLKPEVDNGGYDLVLSCGGITRHIQLKSSFRGASTRAQSVNRRLSDKPSGCVIWMYFEPTTLALGPFLWFGASPGLPLPELTGYPVAKHTKGNAQGIKLERPNIRKIPRSAFTPVETVPELVKSLLGDLSQWRLPANATLELGDQANEDDPECA